jgi:hypothetical protein
LTKRTICSSIEGRISKNKNTLYKLILSQRSNCPKGSASGQSQVEGGKRYTFIFERIYRLSTPSLQYKSSLVLRALWPMAVERVLK